MGVKVIRVLTWFASRLAVQTHPRIRRRPVAGNCTVSSIEVCNLCVQSLDVGPHRGEDRPVDGTNKQSNACSRKRTAHLITSPLSNRSALTWQVLGGDFGSRMSQSKSSSSSPASSSSLSEQVSSVRLAGIHSVLCYAIFHFPIRYIAVPTYPLDAHRPILTCSRDSNSRPYFPAEHRRKPHGSMNQPMSTKFSFAILRVAAAID